MNDVTIRLAQRQDCADIAKLFLISSDGLAEYIWGQMNMPGLTLQEIGERRYAREGVAFSYENCLTAERNGAMIGMLHSFPMVRDETCTDKEEQDPVLKPYSGLADYDSLYISSVAVYPEYRGQGMGTRLLDAARERCRALGLSRVSLICFEPNAKAMQLYQRLGYKEQGRHPIVPHPALHYSEGDAVLLVQTVSDK